MGYTTYFQGEVLVEPPLDAELVTTLTAFSEERHGGPTKVYPDSPGFWCDIAPTTDGISLVWNGNEKSYDMPEWMQYIIDNFIVPTGRVCNGELYATGEEPGDIWLLNVEDNVVKVIPAVITFPKDD